MDANNIFCPVRFGRLVNKYIVENRSRLLLILATPLVAMTIFALLMSDGNSREGYYTGVNNELGFFVIMTFIFGMKLSSGAFLSMSKPKEALASLTLPTSQLEEFLVRWLALVPGFMLWSVLCALFADSMRVVFTRFILHGVADFTPWCDVFTGSGGPLMWPENAFYYIVMVFMVLQSFFFLGAIVWRRNHFLKTFFVLSVIYGIYCFVAVIITRMLSWHGVGYFIMTPMVIMSVLTILINYVLVYMRLRESEIINRW